MLKDNRIQRLTHPVGALPYSPCSLPASGIDSASGISLSALISQLTSSSLLVVCPAPSPTLLLIKMLLLLVSVISEKPEIL